MRLRDISGLYAKSPGVMELARVMEDSPSGAVFLRGLPGSAAPMVFSALAGLRGGTFLFILNDSEEAGYFHQDLAQVLGGDDVLFFPSSYRRQVRYGQLDPGSQVMRTETLGRLSALAETGPDGAGSGFLCVVTYPEAVAELVVARETLGENTLCVRVGTEIEIPGLERRLGELGFSKVDYVYGPGQFARRGSILDVYSYGGEYPYRIDFLGDEVDSIRTFDVASQLSIERKGEAIIVPELSEGARGKVPMLKYLPKGANVVARDLDHAAAMIDKARDEGFVGQAVADRLAGLGEEGRKEALLEMDAGSALMDGKGFLEGIRGFRLIEIGGRAHAADHATISFGITPQPLFHKSFTLLADFMREHAAMGYGIYMLADSPKQHERLREILSSQDVMCDVGFIPVDRTLHSGFIDGSLPACFLTDHQIFDRFHKYNLKSSVSKSGRMALTMKELQEMEVGDYVVHVDLGIGRFQGLMRVPNGNGWQEVIRIAYLNNDKVDVSIHSLYKVSRYRRSDPDNPPRLSALGTGAWDKLKQKAKRKIKDMARDLMRLYAARRHEKGFAFSQDSFIQHELEASFMYEDTPDQLRATNEVKADMESAHPMDRLICGDVGFGKTEVAIRAAVKAACDSKQVAVLVPTTILAYQHYQTFSERLRDFPVRVEYLSRAHSCARTKEILADLESGRIDVVIGTHKLLGAGVRFKDLGLLIIDEEQKFGVAAKEKLRQRKANVDTLAMTATPIPRTLQFSLMGARDMSVIKTAPPNRYPIQTEAHPFGKDVIIEAVNFEMSRNGQVFFVSNRISSLQPLADLLHRHIPDVRVAVAHGKMRPEELERTMVDFMDYEYDVLLSTTIVENGLDITNANTIIINNAHRFGLADLHQMRGRVGRTNRKAFCYLLTPPRQELTREACLRLDAVETFSELGGGFNISMQDLDIRGAGNLFGPEQSGFIEDLGFETYQKILNQAMAELRNDEFAQMYRERISEGVKVTGDDFVDDCSIESDLELYLPEEYVPSSSERMLLYRELNALESDHELQGYRERLVDRFGKIPRQGRELLQLVPLRRKGKGLGCEKITLKNGCMRLQLVGNPESAYYQSDAFGRMLDYIALHPRTCGLRESGEKRVVVMSGIGSVSQAVGVLREMEGAAPAASGTDQ